MSAPPRPGKTPKAENFPVHSRHLPAGSRAPVLAFYRFARHADDIADSPEIDPEEKLARLDALGDGLQNGNGPPEASALRDALAGTPAPVEPALMLLDAFRQDARGKTYESWNDLILYCSFSAVPAGRFLLTLHNEHDDARRPADALCTAHQVLSILRNCGDDYRRLGRVYIPAALLPDPGLLAARRAAPDLRRAIDDCLDRVEDMLAIAGALPRRIRHRGLAGQAAMTTALGSRLAQRLRRRDPLAEPVRLGRLDFLLAGFAGLRQRLR
ncbi:MAG: squalene/phytoene synthase family protein [Alphaproteobacteria bacterium]|nr:squalene/phytoene synthase family protein [Alphaproteobacteria bacterium]